MTAKIYTYIVIAFLLTASVANSAAREDFTCTVKVVDEHGHPLSKAEVGAYENSHHYANGEIISKPLGQIKTTPANGIVNLILKADSRLKVQIVARKPGFALDWARIHKTHPEPTATLVLYKPVTTSGKVTDENGNPIADADVTAIPTKPSMGRQQSLPDEIMTVKTNENGQFFFNEFAPDMTMGFRVTSLAKATVYTGFESDGFSKMSFQAGDSDIEITQPKEGIINGIVFDENRKKVGGVDLLARIDHRKTNYQNVYRAISKPDGTFSFNSLPEGKYIITVAYPFEQTGEYVSYPARANVKNGQATNRIKLQLRKGNIVEVTVRNSITGKPVKNAWVKAAQQKNSMGHSYVHATARTDQKGTARLRVLRGKCFISAGHTEYAGYVYDEPVVRKNLTKLELLLSPLPRARGIVRDKYGKPLPDAIVMVNTRQDISKTNKYGEFDFNYEQRARKYFLFAMNNEGDQAAAIKIDPHNKMPLNIQLKDANTIRGSIKDENGKPLANVQVLFIVQTPGVLSSLHPNEITTDSDGNFEISGIPPQRKPYEYRLRINTRNHGSIEDKDIAFNEWVAEKSYVLKTANMSVSGIVIGKDGKPAVGVPVMSNGPAGSRYKGQPHRNAITDENGKFTINRVCKGPLRLQAGWASQNPGFLNVKGGDKNLKIILGQRTEDQEKHKKKDKTKEK